MNANFEITNLTRLGMRPEYTAPEADGLSSQTIELAKLHSLQSRLALEDDATIARGLGFDTRPVKSHAMSPTARNRCDV